MVQYPFHIFVEFGKDPTIRDPSCSSRKIYKLASLASVLGHYGFLLMGIPCIFTLSSGTNFALHWKRACRVKAILLQY